MISRELAIIIPAKDHLSGGGLVNRCYDDIHRLVNGPPASVNHHHGPIVQVSHALVVFLAFAQDENAHGLARQNHRLQRVRELIDVEHIQPLQGSHFVQVVVIGHDLGVVPFGQFDQLQVHFGDLREIVFGDLDLQVRHLLHSLQDLETAPATLPLEAIGRVRHQLEFPQDKLRHNQHALEKVRFANIRDPAVDDDAGVQDFRLGASFLHVAKEAAQGLQIQHVPFAGAENQANVSHHKKNADIQKRPRILGNRCASHHQAHQISAYNSQNRAHCRADQPPQTGALQADFEEENRDRKNESYDGGNRTAQPKRVKMVSGSDTRGGEYQPYN